MPTQQQHKRVMWAALWGAVFGFFYTLVNVKIVSFSDAIVWYGTIVVAIRGGSVCVLRSV
jgi:hypothetical protein